MMLPPMAEVLELGPVTCQHLILIPLVNVAGVTVALECERCGETFEATS